MKCIKCGFNLNDENFCPKCGAKVIAQFNGIIFEAIMTNVENIGSDLKRRVIFVDHARNVPFQFLIDAYFELYTYYRDTFIKDNCIFKDTGKICDKKLSEEIGIINDLYDNNKGILYEVLRGNNFEMLKGIFSNEKVGNRELLVDMNYKEMYNGNKQNILFINKIIQVETENLVRVAIGDLFWVMPKHGTSPMAIGKIINIIKNL